MIACVQKTIEKYHMLKGVGHVMVGLSGGPDSVALLQVLYQLKEIYHYQLEAIHLNHQLRGEDSKQDQLFCQNLCRELDIPLHLYQEDIALYSKHHKLSLEEAGRQVRYGLFHNHLGDCSVIALGHHQDDLAETMLYNLIRGTGLKGLTGIPPIRKGFIRPLFEVNKQQIIAYLEENGCGYRRDQSNLSTDYTRNKIRLELIPYIEEAFNPQFKKSMGKLSSILRADEQYLEEESQKIFFSVALRTDTKVSLKVKELMTYPFNMRRRVYEISLKRLVQPLKNIGYIHYRQIDNLLSNESGKFIRLPADLSVYREGEYLIFSGYKPRNEPERTFVDEVVPRDKDWTFRQKDLTVESRTVNQLGQATDSDFYIDQDVLVGNLRLRNRMPGDKIYLTGLGHKKLKKWCQEQRMSQEMRQELLVLADEAQIIWVLGYLKNDHYKADKNTKNILKITMNH